MFRKNGVYILINEHFKERTMRVRVTIPLIVTLTLIILNPDEWVTNPLIGKEPRMYYGTDFVFYWPQMRQSFTSN